MDNPTRWNITNSAQNIVSALVDPSKQFDHVFRREWSNTFSGFARHNRTSSPSTSSGLRSKQDGELLNTRLADYLSKLEDRKAIKLFEAEHEVRMQKQREVSKERTINIAVPEVFLMEAFDLSNLEIFKEVVSLINDTSNRRSKLVDKKSSISSSSRENNEYDYEQDIYRPRAPQLLTRDQLKELQQSFTDYLDIIEEKLASQISNRSGDFFQVMSSVDSVMDELSLAIKSVTNLRRKCSTINDALILPNMRTVQLTRARNNAQLVLNKMKEISELCKVQPMIQLLLLSSDFNGALDLIAKSRAQLHKDLTSVACLKHLESHLVETERVIANMMQQEFIEQQRFVNRFHEERKRRIESNLDIEQWKAVDEIPQDFQKLISMLVDEGISIGETFSLDHYEQHSLPSSLHHSRTSSDATGSAMMATSTNEGHQASDSLTEGGFKKMINGDHVGLGTTPIKHVSSTGRLSSIATSMDSNSYNNSKPPKYASSNPNVRPNGYVNARGQRYVIVNSVINLVRIVMEYCKCAQDIRSLSAELLERLFKILQLYNSKTYHLVYSAGAIQVAGLKTITTRSLVVSQRSLQLISLIIPALQEHFAQLLPDDNRLRRFDEIRASYEDHAGKIPERVISIVRDVINLQLQEWEAKPPVPSAQFTAVAQNLWRLHDNIQDALPSDEFTSLFIKISETFKDVLIAHLRRLNISNDAGPQQWLVTQELTFYKITSSKLGVFKGLELNFDDLWTRLSGSAIEAVGVEQSDGCGEESIRGKSGAAHSTTTTTPSLVGSNNSKQQQQ